MLLLCPRRDYHHRHHVLLIARLLWQSTAVLPAAYRHDYSVTILHPPSLPLCLQSVRSILEAAAVPPESPGAGRWVHTSWLEEWANAEGEPREVDNRPLLCAHGRLDPGKVREAKRISEDAWAQLQV